MKDNISVVLATYNEKEQVLGMISDIKKSIKNLKEIIIVDDNSPDGTWKLVEDLKDKKIKLIRRMNERGLASAYRRGFSEVSGDIVCWMDCDSCMPMNTLNDMIKHVGEYDIVVGSKYANGGKDLRGTGRKMCSKALSIMAQICFGFDFKDYTSGFAAVKKKVFDKIKINPEGYGEYFIDFIVKAKRLGYKYCEIGFDFRDRDEGEGSSKSAPNLKSFLKHGWNYGIRILKLKFRLV